MKINACKQTSFANVRILDKCRPTHEKRKGDKVLCMTKLDALRSEDICIFTDKIITDTLVLDAVLKLLFY